MAYTIPLSRSCGSSRGSPQFYNRRELAENRKIRREDWMKEPYWPQDNCNLPTTKILVELQRTAAWAVQVWKRC